jgi:threonine/homoserine/homoserine lactone efflux protein
MLTSMFLKGLVVGFMIAAPVGPVNVLCARRTIVNGRLVGIVSGLGAALADTFFGAVAAFGLVFVHTLLLNERFWLGLGGTIILVVIGVRTLTADVPRPKQAQEDAANLLGDFTSTFVLTLFNPVTILSFLACFSAFGIDNDDKGDLDDWLLLLGVFTGATVWWLFLTTAVGMFRSKFDQETLRWANRIAGVVILAFAAVILWNVATVRL